MTAAVIGSLALLAGYLGKRWLDARAENSALRVQVVSLKKRLAAR